MHILFLTHYFPPEVNAPASRTYEHARWWAGQPGIRVTVVTNHPHHPNGVLYPGYKNRWVTKEVRDGIKVVRLKTLLAANEGILRRTASYLFFMLAATIGALGVDAPDVVVATSPQFFCTVAGWMVSRLWRRPFVFEVRDLWPESIVAVGAMRPGLLVRLLEKVELFLYRQAAHVVPVTDSFRDNLVQRGVPDDRITVIKNGVDLRWFQPRPPSSTLIRQLGAEGKTVVSYIGTVGMAHGVESIVAAADRLRDDPNLLFVVVGDGADKRRVEALASERRLPNMRLLPAVSKELVREYYAVSALSLVTLRAKPLFSAVIPSKIFEIMAMGRPILTTVDGECRRIIEAAGSGEYVEPDNPAALAQAIQRLCRQPGLLKLLGERGLRFVREHFDRDRMAERYLELLRRLTGWPDKELCRSEANEEPAGFSRSLVQCP